MFQVVGLHVEACGSKSKRCKFIKFCSWKEHSGEEQLCGGLGDVASRYWRLRVNETTTGYAHLDAVSVGKKPKNLNEEGSRINRKNEETLSADILLSRRFYLAV